MFGFCRRLSRRLAVAQLQVCPSFAGGFIGYLASAETFTDDVYRQAVICGSAMASLSVEDFGLSRLLSLADEDIRERFDSFRHLTSFEQL